MYDFFYFKEHLFIVSELLRENLYEFGKFVRESGDAPYFTLRNLKKIAIQMLEALNFVHKLGLIHCDVKVSRRGKTYLSLPYGQIHIYIQK
jgi:dual specificity tyrosine-phosphorylation-regulated kinase 2/3/4